MTREREEHEEHVAIADNGGRDEHYDDDDDDDARRAFVGRIPRKFDTDSVRRILEQRLLASAGWKANVDKGKGSVVVDVSLAYPRNDGTERGGGGGGGGSDGNGNGNGNESGKGYGDGGENGESGRKHTRFDFDSDDGDDDQNRDRDRDDAAGAVGRGQGRGDKTDENEHLGYGFVTFASAADRDRAVALVTIRGGAKDSSRRKHTLYIRPVLRRKRGGGGVVVDEDVTGEPMADDGAVENKYACHLWPLKRCPYGDSCRFAHVGEGGCVAANNDGDGDDAATTKTKNGRRRQKCFSFKKRGKCRLGDACRFSHDVAVVAAKGGDNDGNDAGANDMSEANADDDDDDDGDAVDHPQEKDVGKGNGHDNTVDSEVVSEMNTKGTNIYNQEKMIEKHCLDWKIKGKCRRRGRGCPYRHDESVQKKSNKNGKGKNDTKSSDNKNKRRNKREKQPLRVRVFGLNYETSESDVRSHFEHCGPIVECAYPTFHDSGRSKGYCGLLFQSPKAVQKALELDGSILHDRWLRVQPGEMFERLWEKRERERRWDKSADDYNHHDDGGDAAAADADAAKRYRKKEDGEAGAGSGASDKGDGNKYEKVQSVRDTENNERDGTTEAPMVGEFGQKVKKRKRHGYALDKA